MINAPRWIIDLTELPPISGEMLSAANWRVEFRKEIMNNV
jgi:hypothetical protein